MTIPVLDVAFGFVAGLLSTLSPCVLPLLPLVLGSAVGAHRWGPAALGAGLVVSFTIAGLLLAGAGLSASFDPALVRIVAGVLLAAIGCTLLFDAMQARFAVAATGAANAANRMISRLTPVGLGGQFLIGALLGLVWSPCVGPTLGAASLMAARGENLGTAGLVMLAFGIGAALPLAAVGLLSRNAFGRWRGRLLHAGKAGKRVMGMGMVAVAALLLTGADRALETALVQASPEWLNQLTTRF